MTNHSRRSFLLQSALGLGGLSLAADLAPTAASGDLSAYPGILLADGGGNPGGGGAAKAGLKPTDKNILGPYYIDGAPHRAKITPPYEPGTVLFVGGIVRAADTGKPIPFAVLDIWQADERGEYYYEEDPKKQKLMKPADFLLRARLVTGEDGHYEYETIHPGAYQIGENAWRPAHIHYMVTALGYTKLITQMYFEGDKHNKTDQFIRDSLIMPVGKKKSHGQDYESVTFDIVLAKAP